jgi:hypothetical protein
MFMSKRMLLLLAMCSIATTTLHAGETIETEKVDAAQLQQKLQGAADDTVIEIQGVSKSKAQWRADFRAEHSFPNDATLKEMADHLQSDFEAAAKVLQEKQDRKIVEQNAKITKEFNALTSR